MPVTDLLIWYLAIYGMAWTIVHSKLTAPLHDYINEQYIAHNRFKTIYNNCLRYLNIRIAIVGVNYAFAKA